MCRYVEHLEPGCTSGSWKTFKEYKYSVRSANFQELRQSVRAGNCYRDMDTLWSTPSCNSTFWKSLLVQQRGIFVTADTTIYQIISASVFLLRQTQVNTQKHACMLESSFQNLFLQNYCFCIFRERLTALSRMVLNWKKVHSWIEHRVPDDPQLWIPV